MSSKQVYDLPTRFFHWIFVAFFIGAFGIAKWVDDEFSLFSYHMLLGLTLCFVVGLRVLWGFVGTQYARFTSFELRPSAVLLYAKGLFYKGEKRWFGHNPASSWSALLMMALALGLGVTGILMTQGEATLKENIEDIHEVLANALLVMAIAHVAGVFFHTIRHRDPLAFSMIDGKKQEVLGEKPIASTQPWVAGILILLIVGFSWNLLRGFNPEDRTLDLLGWKLTLGEEGHEHNQDDNAFDDHDHDDRNHDHHDGD